MNAFSRTELLFGTAAMERLAQARVAVFGIGGVGGYTVEALARSGVGGVGLDRQRYRLHIESEPADHSIEKYDRKYKVDVMKERILDINPDIKVHVHKCFLSA